MRNKLKYIPGLLTILLLSASKPVLAAGPAPASVFSNPLAVTFLVLMFLLLIVIGILATIMIGAADLRLKKKKEPQTGKTISLILFALLASSLVTAQDAGNTETAKKSVTTIAGIDAMAFYIMVAVLFIELVIIIALLINIKFLLQQEKARQTSPVAAEQLTSTEKEKSNRLNWWDRFNKLRPVSQEAELDLGHEYDGIRELNNRLPPWWLYGFYLTILFAAVYLWRFHVSHTGPSSKEEYESSVARAELSVQEYLKKKGEAVDENTVKLLTSEEDIAAGKAIFLDPAKCPACHNADGGGNTVGPNLTDEYWLYGGSIKDIFKTIKYGTSKGMRSWKDDLSAKQIAQVASYIHSIKGSKPAAPKAPEGKLYIEEPNVPGADSAVNKL